MNECQHAEFWFSRICECGGMHYYCSDCGQPEYACPAMRAASEKKEAIRVALLDAHDSLKMRELAEGLELDHLSAQADARSLYRTLKALVDLIDPIGNDGLTDAERTEEEMHE